MMEGVSSYNPVGEPHLIYPGNNDFIYGDTITFKWLINGNDRGAFSHNLYYTKDPYFSGATHIKVAMDDTFDGVLIAEAGFLFFVFGVVFIGRARNRKRVLTILFMAGIITLLAGSCADPGNSRSFSTEHIISHTLAGLEIGATYYWKVGVDDGNGTQMESEVRSFSVRTAPAPASTAVSHTRTAGIQFKTGN